MCLQSIVGQIDASFWYGNTLQFCLRRVESLPFLVIFWIHFSPCRTGISRGPKFYNHGWGLRILIRSSISSVQWLTTHYWKDGWWKSKGPLIITYTYNYGLLERTWTSTWDEVGPWYLIPDADAAFILMRGFLGGFSSSWHFPCYCSSLGKQQASSPVVGFPVTCLLELSALDLEL